MAIVFVAGRGSIWFIWLTNQWWEQSIWPIWLVDIFSYLLNCFVTVTAVLVSCPQRDHTAPWWYLMVCLCGDSLDPLGSSQSQTYRWGLVRGTVGGVIPPLASDCWDWLHPRSWKKRAINEPIAIFSSVRIRFLLVCLFVRCDLLISIFWQKCNLIVSIYVKSVMKTGSFEPNNPEYWSDTCSMSVYTVLWVYSVQWFRSSTNCSHRGFFKSFALS